MTDLDETSAHWRTLTISHRPRTLILAILGTIYDDPDPTPWSPLIAHFADNSNHPAKTIENTLYDLAAFGAITRIGHPRQGRLPDTRALKATPLGRAWLAGQLLPTPQLRTDQHE